MSFNDEQKKQKNDNITEDEHYVSKFYLKAFGDKSNPLKQVSLKEKKYCQPLLEAFVLKNSFMKLLGCLNSKRSSVSLLH